MTTPFLNDIKCAPPDIVVLAKKDHLIQGPVKDLLLDHYTAMDGAPTFRFFDILGSRRPDLTCN